MQGDIFHLFYMGRAMNTDNRPGTRGQSILSSAAIALAAGIGVAVTQPQSYQNACISPLTMWATLGQMA